MPRAWASRVPWSGSSYTVARFPRCDPVPGSGPRRRMCLARQSPVVCHDEQHVGRALRRHNRGGHQAFDSEAFSPIIPPNCWIGLREAVFRLIVVVAPGEPVSLLVFVASSIVPSSGRSNRPIPSLGTTCPETTLPCTVIVGKCMTRALPRFRDGRLFWVRLILPKQSSRVYWQ